MPAVQVPRAGRVFQMVWFVLAGLPSRDTTKAAGIVYGDVFVSSFGTTSVHVVVGKHHVNVLCSDSVIYAIPIASLDGSYWWSVSCFSSHSTTKSGQLRALWL